MSTEDLLKRAAELQGDTHDLAEEDYVDQICESHDALAAALRESERQLAEARQRLIDTERTMSFYRQEVVTASRDDLGRAGRIVELEAKLAESERQLAEARAMASSDLALNDVLAYLREHPEKEPECVGCTTERNGDAPRPVLDPACPKHGAAEKPECACPDEENSGGARRVVHDPACPEKGRAKPPASAETDEMNKHLAALGDVERLTQALAEARRQRDEAYADLKSDATSRATDELARRSGK